MADYKTHAQSTAEKSPLFMDCLKAFFCGGAICCAAEGLNTLYKWLGATEKQSSGLISVTLIFIAVLLTGIGVFDKIAKFAGAGTLVPITGFANAVAAPAIDCKSEGYVMGVGAKIFTVAGPVILYGIAAGAVYGVILWLTGLI